MNSYPVIYQNQSPPPPPQLEQELPPDEQELHELVPQELADPQLVQLDVDVLFLLIFM